MEKIIVKIRNGFGNKIFNLIIGLYLKKVNGGELYLWIEKSSHENNTDPTIADFFPKLNNYYNVIASKDELSSYYNSEHLKFKCFKVKNIDGFKLNIKEKIILLFDCSFCYKFTYEIFNLLDDEIKNKFSINKKLIAKDILDISKQKYACIHIRYGDKLHLSINMNQFYYLLYTPKFYKYIINKLLKKNINIYIITDDIKIVNKYILNDINTQNIHLLNTNWWDSFYVLANARHCVLSISTFSFLACMINKHLRLAYVVVRPKDIQKYSTSEEIIIYNTPWYKKDNKRFILNYDMDLMKKMSLR